MKKTKRKKKRSIEMTAHQQSLLLLRDPLLLHRKQKMMKTRMANPCWSLMRMDEEEMAWVVPAALRLVDSRQRDLQCTSSARLHEHAFSEEERRQGGRQSHGQGAKTHQLNSAVKGRQQESEQKQFTQPNLSQRIETIHKARLPFSCWK